MAATGVTNISQWGVSGGTEGMCEKGHTDSVNPALRKSRAFKVPHFFREVCGRGPHFSSPIILKNSGAHISFDICKKQLHVQFRAILTMLKPTTSYAKFAEIVFFHQNGLFAA